MADRNPSGEKIDTLKEINATLDEMAKMGSEATGFGGLERKLEELVGKLPKDQRLAYLQTAMRIRMRTHEQKFSDDR